MHGFPLSFILILNITSFHEVSQRKASIFKNSNMPFNTMNRLKINKAVIQQVMSKVNIRFIYRSQQEQQIKEVKSTHKGPINLTNLYDAYANPSYHQIGTNVSAGQSGINSEHGTDENENDISAVNSMQVISKIKSPQAKQTNVQSTKILQVQKTFAQQLKTKMPKKAQTIKPVINIQQINLSQLLKKDENKITVHKLTEPAVSQGQIVLKSPSFKYIPKKEGDNHQVAKKQYVRAEKAEKYFYYGIPQKSEGDFIGCFGCFQQKPKTYQVSQ